MKVWLATAEYSNYDDHDFLILGMFFEAKDGCELLDSKYPYEYKKRDHCLAYEWIYNEHEDEWYWSRLDKDTEYQLCVEGYVVDKLLGHTGVDQS